MKKIFVMLLAGVLTCSALLLFSSCSDDSQSSLPPELAGVELSGTLKHSDDISWSFDNGVLTISGNGEMNTSVLSHSKKDIPWNDYRKSIVSIVINDGVESIYGFEDCVNLTSVTLPDSLKGIDKDTFSGCSSLKNIEIPHDVRYIGSDAFKNCVGLEDFKMPASVSQLGSSAFEGCTELKRVDISEYVFDCGHNAFEGCTKLTEVTLPNELWSLEFEVFCDCTSLKKVTIPSRVTEISMEAFHGCTALTDIYYEGSEEQWNKIRFVEATHLDGYVTKDFFDGLTMHYGS